MAKIVTQQTMSPLSLFQFGLCAGDAFVARIRITQLFIRYRVNSIRCQSNYFRNVASWNDKQMARNISRNRISFRLILRIDYIILINEYVK